MNRLRLLLALPAILALSGCPLVSDHPLSEPKAARIDEALVGAWRTLDLDEGGWKEISFLPFDEHELAGLAPGEEAGAVDAMRAFTTVIEGLRFLNVRELRPGTSPSGWYILRYAIEGDRLVMRPLDDGLFEGRTFAGPAELRRFVRENLANPLLYGPEAGADGRDMVFERVSD